MWLAQPTGRSRFQGGKRAKTEDDRHAKEWRIHCLVRYHAYRLTVHLDAWKQFCAERTMDPWATLQLLPGWATVRRAEVSAREMAFTFEEASLFRQRDAAPLGEASPAVIPQPVETVADLVTEMHGLLCKLVELEGGRPSRR